MTPEQFIDLQEIIAFVYWPLAILFNGALIASSVFISFLWIGLAYLRKMTRRDGG